MHNDKENKDTQKSNKEYDGLKATSVSLVGGNSDGKKLFLDVEVFDGEHTNRFEVDFPLETTAEDVTNYMIEIIEDNPKLPPEIIGLMQRKVFWDAAEKGWYSQAGSEKPVRLKDQDHRADKYQKAQEAKDSKAAKDAAHQKEVDHQTAVHHK